AFLECSAVTIVRAEIGKVDQPAQKGDLRGATAQLRKVARERAALLEFPAAKQLWLEAGRKGARGRLETARKDFLGLVAKEDYRGVSLLKKRLEADWAGAAKEAGAADEFQAFVQRCDFLLTMARSAGKLLD